METLIQNKIVEEKDLAINMGSGKAKVFATPALIAFVENTCMNLASQKYPDSYSVGTRIEASHIKPTLQGQTVTCTAKITEVDRRRIEFDFKVVDDDGTVSEGKHQRFLVPTTWPNK